MKARGSSGSTRSAVISPLAAVTSTESYPLRRLTIIIFEQSPQSLATSERPWAYSRVAWCGHQHHMAQALVGALLVKMYRVFCQGMLQCTLPQQDQSREHFLFDGSHPALGIGIQMGGAWWERHTRDACLINDALKGWTVLTVFVMDERLP